MAVAMHPRRCHAASDHRCNESGDKLTTSRLTSESAATTVKRTERVLRCRSASDVVVVVVGQSDLSHLEPDGAAAPLDMVEDGNELLRLLRVTACPLFTQLNSVSDTGQSIRVSKKDEHSRLHSTQLQQPAGLTTSLTTEAN